MVRYWAGVWMLLLSTLAFGGEPKKPLAELRLPSAMACLPSLDGLARHFEGLQLLTTARSRTVDDELAVFLQPLAAVDADVHALLTTLNDRSLTAAEVKRRTRQWLRKVGLPDHQVVFASGLEAAAGAFRKTGQLQEDGRVVLNGAGLVRADLWNLMAVNRQLPVSDYHDLFFHLPSLLLPGFREALAEKGAFTLKWFQELGIRDYGQLYGPEAPRGGSRDAMVAALRWHATSVRNMTYENLTIVKDGKFTVQGNFALRFFEFRNTTVSLFTARNKLDPSFKKEAVHLLMGDDSPVAFGSAPWIDFHELPRVREFLVHDGERGKQFAELLAKLGMIEPTRSQIQSKLKRLISTEFNKEDPAEEAANQKMERIFTRLAQRTDRDPQLRDFFSSENRIRLLKESSQFLDRYLTWQNSSPSP